MQKTEGFQTSFKKKKLHCCFSVKGFYNVHSKQKQHFLFVKICIKDTAFFSKEKKIMCKQRINKNNIYGHRKSNNSKKSKKLYY